MRISFVKDFPSLDMDYNTYISQFKTKVTLPIGINPSTSLTTSSLTQALNQNYGNQLDIQISNGYLNDSDFDLSSLSNLKLS
jgi:hypothetical protein